MKPILFNLTIGLLAHAGAAAAIFLAGEPVELFLWLGLGLGAGLFWKGPVDFRLHWQALAFLGSAAFFFLFFLLDPVAFRPNFFTCPALMLHLGWTVVILLRQPLVKPISLMHVMVLGLLAIFATASFGAYDDTLRMIMKGIVYLFLGVAFARQQQPLIRLLWMWPMVFVVFAVSVAIEGLMATWLQFFVMETCLAIAASLIGYGLHRVVGVRS